jgi:hypothetical protein
MFLLRSVVAKMTRHNKLLDLAASNGFEPNQKSDVAWNTLTALFQERVESGLDMPSEVFSTWIKDTTKITRK